MRHTPLPWTTRGVRVIKDDENWVCECWAADVEAAHADAEFIASACNSHHGLLEACEMAFGWMRARDGEDFVIRNGTESGRVFEALDHAITKAIQG